MRLRLNILFCFFSFMLLIAPGSHAEGNNRLKDIQFSFLANDTVRIHLFFDKALTADPKHFFTKSPAQLIVDFVDTESGLPLTKRNQTIDKSFVNQLVVAEVAKRLRLVFKLDKVVRFNQVRQGTELMLDLVGQTQPKDDLLKSVRPDFSPSVNKGDEIKDIVFRGGAKNLGRLTVKVANVGTKVDIVKKGEYIYLKFLHASAPENLIRRYDVKDFTTPVQHVDVYQRSENVLIRLEQKGLYKYFAYQVDKSFIVEVEPRDAKSEKIELKDKVYTGKRISLNFQNIPVRSILQLLAEFTGINIVISDTVSGNITLRLNEVPWDQALDIIMQTRGLDKRLYGGVLMIGPAADIAAKERQELTNKMEVDLLSPLVSELIQINYAKADDISSLLRKKGTSLLSPRGKVSVDARTNNLWIQDVGSQLTEIKKLINKLDVPVKQVLIEARVVTIEKRYSHSIGARFGLNRPKANTNAVTSATPYSVVTRGLQGKLNITSADRFNVDLPANFTTGENVGTFGLALAKLGRGFLLDLELSALEVEGKGKVVANPRLVTANQQAAFIESGQEIPYQQTSSSGATVIAFKEAVLKLEVMPQITPDGKIILDLQIKQDNASSDLYLGVPAIDTKKVKTRALVDNGETVVLGGVYQQEYSHDLQHIPFLGKLPIIGPLFRNKSGKDDVNELIIFVTPRIIQQSSITG